MMTDSDQTKTLFVAVCEVSLADGRIVPAVLADNPVTWIPWVWSVTEPAEGFSRLEDAERAAQKAPIKSRGFELVVPGSIEIVEMSERRTVTYTVIGKRRLD